MLHGFFRWAVSEAADYQFQRVATVTEIPASIAAIYPAWLTDRLRAFDPLMEAGVVSFAAEPIGAGFGFLDCLARLTLAYDRPNPRGPQSLVVKASAVDPRYRQIGAFYNAYEREARFYEEVAPRSPVRLPRCYGHSVDSATGAHLLLLEDLGALTPGDQVTGLTLEQAEATLRTLGRFHAAWWNRSELSQLAWMPQRNLRSERYAAAWHRTRQLVADRFSPDAAALGDRLADQLPVLLDQLDRPPLTIVHSDFRADNLLFDGASHDAQVVIVDWQLAIRSRGMLDVARLLGGSVAPQIRRASELPLLRALARGADRGRSARLLVRRSFGRLQALRARVPVLPGNDSRCRRSGRTERFRIGRRAARAIFRRGSRSSRLRSSLSVGRCDRQRYCCK
ncbi:MAG: phosphotransferase [Pirellulales bacterium]